MYDEATFVNIQCMPQLLLYSYRQLSITVISVQLVLINVHINLNNYRFVSLK